MELEMGHGMQIYPLNVIAIQTNTTKDVMCLFRQVMAIATLSACYNNPLVFQGVVKIRKGQAVTLMMEATNMQAVKSMIAQYSQEVRPLYSVHVFICTLMVCLALYHLIYQFAKSSA